MPAEAQCTFVALDSGLELTKGHVSVSFVVCSAIVTRRKLVVGYGRFEAAQGKVAVGSVEASTLDCSTQGDGLGVVSDCCLVIISSRPEIRSIEKNCRDRYAG